MITSNYFNNGLIPAKNPSDLKNDNSSELYSTADSQWFQRHLIDNEPTQEMKVDFISEYTTLHSKIPVEFDKARKAPTPENFSNLNTLLSEQILNNMMISKVTGKLVHAVERLTNMQ